MATAGVATKRSANRRRKMKKKVKKGFKSKATEPQIVTDKRLSHVIPLLISTTSDVHSFLLRHDLQLLPSQTLAFESLLSSTTRSLARLVSLRSISIPSTSLTPPKQPPQNWFQRFLSSSHDNDPRWVHFFNLSKSSFNLLLRILTPSLSSSLHPPLSPSVALAATLFRLSHGASFSSVAHRFSLDSPTACRAFYTVCKAIVESLGHLFEFNSDINRIVVGFGWISLPNCCGVLGVEKFELERHPLGKIDSLLVQALVDSEGRFLDVSAGWPGSNKPINVLKNSKLYSGIEKSKVYLQGPHFELTSGNSMPQYILGDPCYPLLPWLMTPFTSNNTELTSSEKVFNEFHYRGMGLVGEAFGKVKKTFKLAGKKWKEQCIEAFPFVVVACCLMHNFLIKCGENLREENLENSREPEFPSFDGEDDNTAKRYRDALALHLSGE